MGTNELVEKILGDGRARVAAIVAERERAVAGTRARAAAEVAAIEAETRQKTERECGAVMERARGKARLEQRNAVLAARWQVLDLAVRRAQEKLLADPAYPELIVGLVRKYARPGSVARLTSADSRLFGTRLGLPLAEPLSSAGGVLIRTGKEELNFSMGEALSALRDELARDLYRVLFPS